MAFRKGLSLARRIGSLCHTSLGKNTCFSPGASPGRFSSSAWPEDHFYQGKEIYNQVTWRADGHPLEAQASHAFSVGHQRLWNFMNGRVLDIGKLNVGERCIYTTAQSGTFYLTIRHGQHWVTLVIDGREGWCYGIQNKNGKFEFKHTVYPHKKYMKRSKVLKDVEGNYGVNGLCPDGLHMVSMGFISVEMAVEVLSEYDGEVPVPIKVCKACATLLYGPESAKLHDAFYASSSSLLVGDVTLGDLRPALPRRVRKWNTMSESLLHVSALRLDSGVFVPPNPSSVSGVYTIEQLLDEVAMIPYNRTVDSLDTMVTHHTGNWKSFRPDAKSHQHKRNWKAFLPDANSHQADGKPHFRSKDFVPRPSPMLFD